MTNVVTEVRAAMDRLLMESKWILVIIFVPVVPPVLKGWWPLLIYASIFPTLQEACQFEKWLKMVVFH